MKLFNQLKNKKSVLLFTLLILIAAGFMLQQIDKSVQTQLQLSEQKVLQEAIAHFDNMVITRAWNAMYGGVYVKQKSGITPNSYLKDNVLKLNETENLIKINPAWMTRQISELSNKKSRYYYKITSLKPINPHNAADNFEVEALKYFDLHKNKKYYYQFSQNKKVFNFMGALKTEKECLVCHSYQGYKVGDIRGGIRVSIPTDILQNEIYSIKTQARNNIIFVIISTLTIISVFLRFVTILYRQKHKIEKLNQFLEKTVQDRTYELEKMYQHEKYIKNLLKIVASVNDLLLASMSAQGVLKDSVNELIKYSHYQFIWVGFVKEGWLEVAHKSPDNNDIIEENIYNLNDDLVDTQIHAALQAITNRVTVVKPYSLKNTVQKKLNVQWLISIPIITTDSDKPFGVFNIYSDREQGFEPEEISILERLSTDISLVLHAQKQKAIMEKMELEKVSNYEETILAFVNIIEKRDTYTAGHTLRVAEYCKIIAAFLKVEPEQIKKLERAAILHDIGKVATPDAVLLKPSKLTVLEYELIKQHAYAGFDMLSKIDMYKDLAQIIRYHHVRYDGNGYPLTQSPNDVPFLSHIMAVADAFDAMTTNRIYKPRQSVAAALSEISSLAGSQFHPVVVKAALIALKNTQVSHLNQEPNSELEQKRFSYFFCDALTDLYNDHYLHITLANPERKYNHLYFIFLNNFSSYNKQYGWENGSQALVEFAKYLKETFPESMGFRYHGDDFILLLEKKMTENQNKLELCPLFLNSKVNVATKYYELTNTHYEISVLYEKINTDN